MLAFMAATNTFALPPGLLQAVCYVESTHNVKAVRHHDGGETSLGVCQIKHSTARMLGYTGTAKQLMDLDTNAYWAAAYLRKQINRYPGELKKAVAAYNSGTYREVAGVAKNRKYVKKVMTAWEKHK